MRWKHRRGVLVFHQVGSPLVRYRHMNVGCCFDTAGLAECLTKILDVQIRDSIGRIRRSVDFDTLQGMPSVRRLRGLWFKPAMVHISRVRGHFEQRPQCWNAGSTDTNIKLESKEGQWLVNEMGERDGANLRRPQGQVK